MKVYVVRTGQYSDIEAVYDNEEAAKALVASTRADGDFAYYVEYGVQS